MSFQKVQDNPNLSRDLESNGILQTNTTSLESYRANRDRLKKLNEKFLEVDSNTKNILVISNDIESIKLTLLEVLQNIKDLKKDVHTFAKTKTEI